MDFVPSVYQAVPGEGYSVYAYFNDGTVRLVDVNPLIEKGGIFSQIADIEIFRATLTVMNHTTAWDISGTRDSSKCIDLNPCVIYDNSPVVEDPLSPTP